MGKEAESGVAASPAVASPPVVTAPGQPKRRFNSSVNIHSPAKASPGASGAAAARAAHLRKASSAGPGTPPQDGATGEGAGASPAPEEAAPAFGDVLRARARRLHPKPVVDLGEGGGGAGDAYASGDRRRAPRLSMAAHKVCVCSCVCGWVAHV